MSARPHCSSIAATSGSAPTTCVSTRVRASMLRLLGKRETNPQLAKNAKTDVSCPHQPPRCGAEREEFGYDRRRSAVVLGAVYSRKFPALAIVASQQALRL